MICKNIEPLIDDHTPLDITIFVPRGEEIARRTFNPRLGIEGGISIIGVSGIVKPFSEEAFIDSIRKCMTIAKASGSERVVINSGGKSEPSHIAKAIVIHFFQTARSPSFSLLMREKFTIENQAAGERTMASSSMASFSDMASAMRASRSERR